MRCQSCESPEVELKPLEGCADAYHQGPPSTDEPVCSCTYKDDAYKAPEQHSRSCDVFLRAMAAAVRNLRAERAPSWWS
jgi:hypothetical protein